ncbi:MAG: hypothetical protein IKW83_09495 [Muribaculaceae bacterium]|nr:hypothetical protein [Muribaculaceae bacterium]
MMKAAHAIARTALFIFSHYFEISQVSAIRDKQNASFFIIEDCLCNLNAKIQQ